MNKASASAKEALAQYVEQRESGNQMQNNTACKKRTEEKIIDIL